MHYDPILCMNIPDTVRTTDFAGFVLKKENGYELGVNSNHILYLAFPGETMNNPHMYLGKDDPDNRRKAEEMFNKFKNIKHNDSKACDASPEDVFENISRGMEYGDSTVIYINNKPSKIQKESNGYYLTYEGRMFKGSKGVIKGIIQNLNSKDSKTCDSAFDKAIRSCDADEEKWITVKGSHVKIDGEGNPIVGNSNVIEAMKKKSDNKNNNKQSSSRKKLSSFAKSFIDDYDTDEIDEIIESNVHNWEEYNLLSPRQKVEKLFREWGEDDIQDFIDEYESDKHSSLRR